MEDNTYISDEQIALVQRLIAVTAALNPKEFDITAVMNTHGCGSVGCCIGWTVLDPQVEKILGCDPLTTVLGNHPDWTVDWVADDRWDDFVDMLPPMPPWISDALLAGLSTTHETKKYRWNSPKNAAANLQKWLDELKEARKRQEAAK